MHYFKQLSLVIFCVLTIASFAQNVGIGTTTPNSSAILDVASSNKGLLLPRVADTSNVTAPAAGLVIYSQADRAPNYFDGDKWNNVSDARNNFVPVYGSIKYIITGTTSIGGIAVTTGLLDAIGYGNRFRAAYAVGQGFLGAVRGMDSVLFTKEFDGNSILFKMAHLGGSSIAALEIQHFLPGASSPFYSVKLSSVRVIDQSFFISEETGKLTEQYSLSPTKVGYRDGITGKSFSLTISTNVIGAY